MLTSQEDFTSVLVRRKVLTPSQLNGAILLQRQTNTQLWEVLVEFGYASQDQVLAAMYVEPGGREQRFEFDDLVIDPTVIGLVPESVARDNLVIPIQLDGSVLHLAMADPDNAKLLARLKFILRRRIKGHWASREQILECIDRHYGAKPAGSPLMQRLRDAGGASEFELTLSDSDEKKDIFETDFEMSGINLTGAAVEEADADLESSDFDLGLEESKSKAGPHGFGFSRPTQRATDDAAGESLVDTMSCASEVCREEFESMAAPAAAGPPPAPELLSKMSAQESPATRSLGKMVGMRRKESAAELMPMVERQATIRYYSQMAPERMFPLLVVISRKAIMQVVQRDVVQKQSKKFQVQMDSTVEIEPILPGCDCFPPKENAKITAAESTAKFWVVPRVLGTVMHARVIVRQNGKVLAEVPLEMNVAKQTLTVCVGAMNFCVPFVSMLLKQSQLSLTSSDGGTGLVAALVGWLLVMLSPEVMAGLLLLATVGLYFWLRPRKRDVFWDIQPAGAPERRR
jgi:Type II secretion system (T2SS), protein E, N-terminal domain